MLIKRAAWVAILLLAGFALATISMWTLAFSGSASETPLFSGRWFLQILPLLLGIALLVGGFRLLGSTRVAPVSPDADDPAP
jgi:hypothetical protein